MPSVPYAAQSSSLAAASSGTVHPSAHATSSPVAKRRKLRITQPRPDTWSPCARKPSIAAPVSRPMAPSRTQAPILSHLVHLPPGGAAGERRAALLAGGDHGIGIGQPRGDRLLAGDPLDARLRARDHRVCGRRSPAGCWRPRPAPAMPAAPRPCRTGGGSRSARRTARAARGRCRPGRSAPPPDGGRTHRCSGGPSRRSRRPRRPAVSPASSRGHPLRRSPGSPGPALPRPPD